MRSSIATQVVNEIINEIRKCIRTVKIPTLQELAHIEEGLIYNNPKLEPLPEWAKEPVLSCWKIYCARIRNQTLATYVCLNTQQRISLHADSDLIDHNCFELTEEHLFADAYPILMSSEKTGTEFYYLPIDEQMRWADMNAGRLPANLNRRLADSKKWTVERLLIHKKRNGLVTFQRAQNYDHKIHRPARNVQQVFAGT